MVYKQLPKFNGKTYAELSQTHRCKFNLMIVFYSYIFYLFSSEYLPISLQAKNIS